MAHVCYMPIWRVYIIILVLSWDLSRLVDGSNDFKKEVRRLRVQGGDGQRVSTLEHVEEAEVTMTTGIDKHDRFDESRRVFCWDLGTKIIIVSLFVIWGRLA